MTKSIRKRILVAVYAIAFIVGCIHFDIGLRAIFVFRNNEPLTSWIALIAGPFSTLPATFLALFKRRFGGYWLIAGGLITLAMLFVSKDISFDDVSLLEVAIRVALICLLPIGLGLSFVYLSKEQKQKTTAT